MRVNKCPYLVDERFFTELYFWYENCDLASGAHLSRGRTLRSPRTKDTKQALRRGARRVSCTARPKRHHGINEPGLRSRCAANRRVSGQGVSSHSVIRIMVAVAQGEIWWADLSEPIGSEPGFRRPVVIVQGDPLNRSRIGTAVVVPLTSNMDWAAAPGNVTLPLDLTGLSKDSVANVSQIVTVDKRTLMERVSKLPKSKLDLVFSGIDIVFDR